MTIIEIQALFPICSFSNFLPFIYKSLPGKLELAEWWEGPDYSRDYNLFVQSFVRDSNNPYSAESSYSDMLSNQGSFFWDNTNQILYIHFEHDQEGWTASYEYGSFNGYTDQVLLDIDGQEYLPLMTNSIAIPQQQDLINYSKLSFISASVELTNIQGVNDFLINGNIYGNSVQVYYAENPQDRSDLIPVASLWVEDYDISTESIIVRLQDRRKQDNITIPRERFSNGDVVPLLYGQVREAKAIKEGSSYRVASMLTSLGTVQANINNVWTTKTPVTVDLPTGSFTLDAEYSEVKVIDPVGINITKLSDIIKDLYSRYLNISFISSNFNTVEFEAESTELLYGGILLDTEQEFFEAVKKIQNGCNRGLRFEIDGYGLRTIRLDDNTREPSWFITPEDIKNRDKLKVQTDSELNYSEISVAYGKSYQSGRYLRVLNNDYRDQVLAKYRNQRRLETETLLLTEEAASDRALYDASRFKDVPKIVEIELFGFMSMRLLDTANVMLTPDWANLDSGEIIGRKFFGYKKCKCIGINPNFTTGINTVRMLIIEDVKIYGSFMDFYPGVNDIFYPFYLKGEIYPNGI